ncbi:lysoplasmalogenase [Flavihumibacter petaseus]|uniref:Lysoplasmalogenase n=1 Tax=Flavihumibacter petaseus NBRC 106054 TaxID=1220578 RepID=A0A0E9N651_9BACT|nr:lysoplasmalogenase [Flavihumibacter petaseus]GAO45283.1 hypothetical protein FPE01S_04_05270 [Flavihumibacter petaseus NBRC 106054]
MRFKGWLPGYLTVALLQLIALAAGWEWLRFVSKPLLMLILLFAPTNGWIRTALVFSWLGDIFLLNEGEHYFMAGLASFLAAHVFYIIAFWRKRRDSQPRKPWNLYVVAGTGVYAAVFFLWLQPHLPGGLRLPVLLYTLVIAAMFIFSFFTNYFCIAGAALFLVSDSLLATNSFYQQFTGGSFLVMLTYISAQLLIVLGSPEQTIKDEKN